MGYFINGFENIANISEPVQVTLSGNSNFIKFSSTKPEGKGIVTVTYKIKEDITDADNLSVTFEETATGIMHQFRGTRDKSEAGDSIFYVDPADNKATANNFRKCLMRNQFFGSKFNISPPFRAITNYNNSTVDITENEYITLESKGTGEQFAFKYLEFGKPDYIVRHLIGLSEFTYNYDSISGGSSNCEIRLDLYKDNGICLGMDDTPEQAYYSGGAEYLGNRNKYGRYITSLTKAYSGQPLWFNLNSVSGNSYSKEFLTAHTWCNTGTMSDVRIIVSRYLNGVNKVFYLSNVLYQLHGYDRTLAENDLSEYIYNTAKENVIKPLTSQPELTHIKGQAQYFNFIFADPNRKNGLGEKEYKIGLKYKLYSSSNRVITEVDLQKQERTKFEMVNTIKLDIDQAIGERKNIAFVEVALYRSDKEEPISKPLRFRILPDCLYKVNDFAFLNRLGGWSSFNFSGNEQTNFQTKTSTYYQTHTPDKNTNSEIESVYGKNVTEHFTVQTMPVTKEVCEWLKELSTSKAAYELRTGRYIIVDDLSIKSNTKDELFRLDMKYHYSDSYNAVIE